MRIAHRTAEVRPGVEHPNLAQSLESYAVLLRKMNREAEAEKVEARVRAMRAKAEENSKQ